MTDCSRRHVLLGTAALVPLGAGCIDSLEASGSGGGDDGRGGEDSGDGSGEGGEGGDGSDAGVDLVNREIRTFDRPEPPDEPAITVHREREDAEAWLDDADVPEGDRESIDDLFRGADFGESLVVVLEARGPDLCHEIAIDEVGIEDGAFTVHAEVQNAAGGEDACAQQVTGLVAVVLATFSDEPPAAISATIVTADGSSYGMSAVTESETDESAGERDSEGGTDESGA